MKLTQGQVRALPIRAPVAARAAGPGRGPRRDPRGSGRRVLRAVVARFRGISAW